MPHWRNEVRVNNNAVKLEDSILNEETDGKESQDVNKRKLVVLEDEVALVRPTSQQDRLNKGEKSRDLKVHDDRYRAGSMTMSGEIEDFLFLFVVWIASKRARLRRHCVLDKRSIVLYQDRGWFVDACRVNNPSTVDTTLHPDTSW
jgi:hypothetical protein